jgi:hypothetical protein
MMEAKDWISGLVGALVAGLGALPLLNKFGTGPAWFALDFLPVTLFVYLVAGIGFYLMINSFIEITNSNRIGWTSFLIAIVCLAIGVLQALGRFGIGPEWFELSFINQTMYSVIFVVEGFFLMIATFAMEI